jgi:hypothetical protein
MDYLRSAEISSGGQSLGKSFEAGDRLRDLENQPLRDRPGLILDRVEKLSDLGDDTIGVPPRGRGRRQGSSAERPTRRLRSVVLSCRGDNGDEVQSQLSTPSFAAFRLETRRSHGEDRPGVGTGGGQGRGDYDSWAWRDPSLTLPFQARGSRWSARGSQSWRPRSGFSGMRLRRTRGRLLLRRRNFCFGF